MSGRYLAWLITLLLCGLRVLGLLLSAFPESPHLWHSFQAMAHLWTGGVIASWWHVADFSYSTAQQCFYQAAVLIAVEVACALITLIM